MPKWRLGGQVFKRKNLYIPCVIADRMDELSPEKQVEVYRKTWWCDLLTEREWLVILNQSSRHRAVVRSILKRKMTGWLMALGRVATFDPDLYNEAVRSAKELYRELCDSEHPVLRD